jgi:hypothetical protein
MILGFMSDIVIVALIAAVASIVSSLIGLAGLLSSLHNKKTLGRVESATNGMNAKLLDASTAASHAQGMKDQREEDRKSKP